VENKSDEKDSCSRWWKCEGMISEKKDTLVTVESKRDR
jgi:hypothetical protein